TRARSFSIPLRYRVLQGPHTEPSRVILRCRRSTTRFRSSPPDPPPAYSVSGPLMSNARTAHFGITSSTLGSPSTSPHSTHAFTASSVPLADSAHGDHRQSAAEAVLEGRPTSSQGQRMPIADCGRDPERAAYCCYRKGP